MNANLHWFCMLIQLHNATPIGSKFIQLTLSPPFMVERESYYPLGNNILRLNWVRASEIRLELHSYSNITRRSVTYPTSNYFFEVYSVSII